MKHNPYQIVKMFEESVAEYAGAPYAVAVDSCTSALFLCCSFYKVDYVRIPSKTYLSVPQAIMHAGGKIIFDIGMNDWEGAYQLWPYPIYDAAKRFTARMYVPGSMMCLSFHAKKILPIGKGGMILTDNPETAAWFRRARYEGRGECFYKDDDIFMTGWNMYMTPEEAAHGLVLLQQTPEQNPDQVEQGGYRNLMEFKLFEETSVIG